MSRMVTTLRALRVLLVSSALLCLSVFGWACGGPQDAEGPDLAPRLLDDSKQLAAWIEAFPVDRYRVTDIPGVGRFYVDDSPGFVKKFLRQGIPWEPYVLTLLTDHVRAGSTALDVGAHIGSIAVPMARLVGPSGQVYAFEPQHVAYRQLVHNLRLNDLGQAVPLRFAVGAENTIIEMNPVRRDDGQVAVGEGGDQAELRTLDGFGFSDVSLIKIDVEGYELEVLKGAEELIRRERPALIVEIREVDQAREETFRKLDELGYDHRKIMASDYLALPRP